jgi:NADH:ubiquinone oxidoreductase subunit K
MVDFFLTHLNPLHNIYLMTMSETFGLLKQKCKEGFGDAVKSIFKNIFLSLIVLIASSLGFVLLLVRQHLGLTFEVSVLQILIILAVFIVIGLAVHWAIYRLRQRGTVSDYCSDVIYDVVWEWDSVLFQNVGKIELTPICPCCDYQLHYHDHPLHRDCTLMECEDCHWTTELQNDGNPIKPVIIKTIEQRIRSGDWMNAQKRLKELKK